MRSIRFVTRRRFMMAAGSTLAVVGARPVLAQRLRIDPDAFQPLPIAITSFVPGTPGDTEVGAGVSQVITNNLKRSGLFAPIDPAAFIERITNPDTPPQ